MKGQTVRTPELVADAIELRRQGLTYREIGLRLGVSLQAAHEWITDTNRARWRARRDSYRKPCIYCGAPTNPGQRIPDDVDAVCGGCRADHYRLWTREAVVAAIQEWAAEHGRPPRASEWSNSRGGTVPAATTVGDVFGSWNAGIEAAGFDAIDMNHKAFDDPDAIPRTVALYQAGVPVGEIARREGITIRGVGMRLRGRTERDRLAARSRRVDALLIEYAAGRPVDEIAAEYGVAPRTVYAAASRRGVRRYATREMAA